MNNKNENQKSVKSGPMDFKVDISAKRTIVVMSGKGGVGKSTVSTHIARGLADRGNRVGLIDADLHGPNAPIMLGVDNLHPTASGEKMTPVQVNENLSVISMALLLESRDTPVIWRGPMKMKALQQFLQDVEWGELDYLVVDLPPGTGDEPLSIAQLLPPPADAIIVTTPQEVALLDSRKTINFAVKLGMNVLGVVENMSGKIKCPHCGEEIDLFGKGGGEKAASEFGVHFLGSIPIDPQMIKLTDSGQPAIADRTPAGKAIERLVDEISSKIDN